MLGLKRGEVLLLKHQKEWEIEAQKTIKNLKEILGDIIVDIQHIGSTSVPKILSKPIIDIAVAVNDFDDVLELENELKINGFYYIFIYVVLKDSMQWINYINFRDYLTENPAVAKEYEVLKLSLLNTVKDRYEYTSGKHEFITYTLRKALVKSYLGKTVHIEIERLIGYIHKKKKYSLTYPINYGYIPNVLGGDEEELYVYLLGVTEPINEADVKIIGIAHRENDIEDKLIAVPNGINFSKTEIENAINFQEKYYKTTVEVIV